MIEKYTVHVVMPSYNEAAHIAEVIRCMPEFIDKIVVVDDHSSDNTSQVVQEMCDPRVELLRNSKNMGVGGATVRGYRLALEDNADIVVKIDSDGQMNPELIMDLIKPLIEGKANYTKGFRFHDPETLRNIPKLRLVGNVVLSYMVKMASGYWNIFDPVNGFTAIQGTSLKLLDLDRISNDYFFETNMLCGLYRFQAKVKDVMLPTHYGDEISHLSPLKTMFQFPSKLFLAYVKRIAWHYYIRDFSAFSLLFLVGWIMILFGAIFGTVQWYGNAGKGILTSTGTVMISILPLMLGFQMVLQAMILDIHNVPKEPL